MLVDLFVAKQLENDVIQLLLHLEKKQQHHHQRA
jgi:hypothetical protein